MAPMGQMAAEERDAEAGKKPDLITPIIDMLFERPRPDQKDTFGPRPNGAWTTGGGDTFKTCDPWLCSIDKLLPRGEGRYWYLAGPMSGKPGFNYPEFDRIAAILRRQAYPIVSPAEFEHESHRKRIAEANGDEDHDEIGTPWADCLARDVAVVSNPRCVGIILIDGWHESRGALLETQVASSLGKPLFEFSEAPLALTQIDRQEALDFYSNAVGVAETDEQIIQILRETVERKYEPTLPGPRPTLPSDPDWTKPTPQFPDPWKPRVFDA